MTNTLRRSRANYEKDGKEGISQRDLALLVSIAEDRYWRIEKGYADPTDDEVARLARALNKPPTDLFPSLAQRHAVSR